MAIIYLLIFALFSSIVYANGTTPMIYPSLYGFRVENLQGRNAGLLLAILLGSFITTIIEVFIAKALFKIKFLKSTFVLFWVNLLSTIVGWQFIALSRKILEAQYSGEFIFYNAINLLILVFILCSLITIMLETPFIHFCFAKENRTIKNTIKSSFIIQTITTLLVVPCLIYSVSFLLETNTTKDLSFVKKPANSIYYIDNKDNSIWHINSDGTNKYKVSDKMETHRRNTVLCLSSIIGRKDADLSICAGHSYDDTTKIIPIVKGLGKLKYAASQVYSENNFINNGVIMIDKSVPIQSDGSYLLKEKVSKINEMISWNTRGSIVNMNTCGRDGLKIRERGNFSSRWKVKTSLAMNTQLQGWQCSNLEVLRNGQIIFLMGNNIIIYDIETQKIGYIATAKNIVVITNNLKGVWDNRAKNTR